jgi:hypothetical protein
MVAADEALRRAVLIHRELGAAMRAAIEHHVQRTAGVAGDDHRLPAHHGGVEAAGLRDLALMAQVQPGPAEDQPHLLLEDRGIHIGRAMHAAGLHEAAGIGRSGRHRRRRGRQTVHLGSSLAHGCHVPKMLASGCILAGRESRAGSARRRPDHGREISASCSGPSVSA